MKKKKKQTWTLNQNEVTWRAIGGSPGGAPKPGRPRDIHITLLLTHTPSGLEVTVEGDCTKASGPEKLRMALYNEAFLKLAVLVARHLRIPGRN